MAKTAIDYHNMGKEAFYCNEPRAIGNSWQAKAMQEGYDNAKNRKRQAEDKEEYSSMDCGMFIDPVGLPKAWKMPKDVQKVKDTRNAVAFALEGIQVMLGDK